MKYTQKQCSCGNAHFFANQRCNHDVIVDGNGFFDQDKGVSYAENPYGTFVCTKCSKEFEELNSLATVESERLVNGRDNLLYRPRMKIDDGEDKEGIASYPVYGTRFISRVVVEMVKPYLEPSDEWNCNANIRFILRKPERIQVFGKSYVGTEIMFAKPIFTDEFALSCVFTNENSPAFECPAPNAVAREVYEIFWMESRKKHGGIFKGCCFDEEPLFENFNEWPARQEIIDNIRGDSECFCRTNKSTTGDIPDEFLMMMVSELTEHGRNWNPECTGVYMEKAFAVAAKTIFPKESTIHCLQCNTAYVSDEVLPLRRCYTKYGEEEEFFYTDDSNEECALVHVCPNCDTDRFLIDYPKNER